MIVSGAGGSHVEVLEHLSCAPRWEPYAVEKRAIRVQRLEMDALVTNCCVQPLPNEMYHV